MPFAVAFRLAVAQPVRDGDKKRKTKGEKRKTKERKAKAFLFLKHYIMSDKENQSFFRKFPENEKNSGLQAIKKVKNNKETIKL